MKSIELEKLRDYSQVLCRNTVKFPQKSPTVLFQEKDIRRILSRSKLGQFEELSLLEKARLLVLVITYLKNYSSPYKHDIESLLQDEEFIALFLSNLDIRLFDYILKKILLIYSAQKLENFPENEVLANFFSNSKKFWKSRNTFLFALAMATEGFYDTLVTDCIINRNPIQKMWQENVGYENDLHSRIHIRKITLAIWRHFCKSVHIIENEATFLYIFREILKPSDSNASERLRWILENIQKDAFRLAQKPLLEYLSLLLGNPPDWSFFPGLNEACKKIYNKLWETFQYDTYFFIAKNYYYESKLSMDDKRILNNRVIFWKNYQRHIRSIKIYYPQKEVFALREYMEKNRLKEFSKSEYILHRLGITDYHTPFAMIHADAFYALEFFNPKTEYTYILTIDSINEVDSHYYNKDTIQSLVRNALYKVVPTPLWISHYARFLLREFDLTPEDPDTFYLPEPNDASSNFGDMYVRKFMDVLNQEQYLPGSSYRETIFLLR